MNRIDYFLDGLKQLNIIPTDTMIRQFSQYYDLLIDWNSRMNLTAITEEADVITKHFLDSLAAVQTNDFNTTQYLLDIGTGAGFPGIPLKIIFPDINLVLLDSVNKKIQFLQEVIKTLSLENVTCIHGRAEDYAKEEQYRERFDCVVSRAVSNLATLSEYCLPFVKVEGKFVAYKSADYEEEVINAKNAIKILGGKIDKVDQFRIPNSDIKRTYVCINKVTLTPKSYPRKAGIPTKNPL